MSNLDNVKDLIVMSSTIEDAAYLVSEADDVTYAVIAGKCGTCQCSSSRSAGGTCRASSSLDYESQVSK